MNEILTSLTEFCSTVVRHWYALAVGVFGGLLGLASILYGEAKPKAAPLVPLALWVTLLAGGLLVAITWAFHDVRLERDRMQAEMAHRFETMRYALQYSGISGTLDHGPEGALYFKPSIDLANHSDEYLRYEIEQAVVMIGGVSCTSTGQPLMIAPHAKSTFMCSALRLQKGGTLQGSLRLMVCYGHPSGPPQYRVPWEFSLHAFGAAGAQTAQLKATLQGEAVVEDIQPAAA